MDHRAASGLDPDHRLKRNDAVACVKDWGEGWYDGLEFVQFYIFVKDGESKYAKDKVATYELYEDQCEQKGRQRLSCDDFIELIRKFHLIASVAALENRMKTRYDQIKTGSVHLETEEKGT